MALSDFHLPLSIDALGQWHTWFGAKPKGKADTPMTPTAQIVFADESFHL